MSDAPVSLASLMTPSKTVTIDFPGYTGMSVDLCYLAREELIKLRKKCITTKWNMYQPINGKRYNVIYLNKSCSQGQFILI